MNLLNSSRDYDNLIVPAVLNKMKYNKSQENMELEYEEQKQKEKLEEKEKALAELTKDQLEQYNLLIPFVEVIGLQKLLSRYIKYKLEGIEILKNKLSNIFISSEIKEIMPVLLEIISNLLEDDNFKSLKTFELIEHLFQYINSLLIFIYNNIDDICLEHVINLFSQLIKTGKKNKIMKYLKEKNVELWISSIDKDEVTEEDEANNDSIMSKDNLPIIKSKHFILTDKENIEIGNKDPNEKNRNSDVNKANEKRLKNININFELMKRIGYDLNKEN